MCHLVRCQTTESRDEAVLDTVKDVMPPQVRHADCMPAQHMQLHLSPVAAEAPWHCAKLQMVIRHS